MKYFVESAEDGTFWCKDAEMTIFTFLQFGKPT